MIDMLERAQGAVRGFESTSDLRSAAEHRLTAIMYALVALAEERKYEAMWKEHHAPTRRARVAQELSDMEGEGAVPA